MSDGDYSVFLRMIESKEPEALTAQNYFLASLRDRSGRRGDDSDSDEELFFRSNRGRNGDGKVDLTVVNGMSSSDEDSDINEQAEQQPQPTERKKRERKIPGQQRRKNTFLDVIESKKPPAIESTEAALRELEKRKDNQDPGTPEDSGSSGLDSEAESNEEEYFPDIDMKDVDEEDSDGNVSLTVENVMSSTDEDDDDDANDDNGDSGDSGDNGEDENLPSSSSLFKQRIESKEPAALVSQNKSLRALKKRASKPFSFEKFGRAGAGTKRGKNGQPMRLGDKLQANLVDEISGMVSDKHKSLRRAAQRVPLSQFEQEMKYFANLVLGALGSGDIDTLFVSPKADVKVELYIADRLKNGERKTKRRRIARTTDTLYDILPTASTIHDGAVYERFSESVQPLAEESKEAEGILLVDQERKKSLDTLGRQFKQNIEQSVLTALVRETVVNDGQISRAKFNEMQNSAFKTWIFGDLVGVTNMTNSKYLHKSIRTAIEKLQRLQLFTPRLFYAFVMAITHVGYIRSEVAQSLLTYDNLVKNANHCVALATLVAEIIKQRESQAVGMKPKENVTHQNNQNIIHFFNYFMRLKP